MGIFIVIVAVFVMILQGLAWIWILERNKSARKPMVNMWSYYDKKHGNIYELYYRKTMRAWKIEALCRSLPENGVIAMSVPLKCEDAKRYYTMEDVREMAENGLQTVLDEMDGRTLEKNVTYHVDVQDSNYFFRDDCKESRDACRDARETSFADSEEQADIKKREEMWEEKLKKQSQ